MIDNRDAELLEIDEPPPKPKASRAAWYSLLFAMGSVLSIIGLMPIGVAMLSLQLSEEVPVLLTILLTGLSMLLALIGLVLGIVAHWRIWKSRGALRGLGSAITGWLISSIMVLLLGGLLVAVLMTTARFR
jgi:hypothetical protein